MIGQKEAKKVIIAPAVKGMVVNISPPSALKNRLVGKPITKGDIVSIGGSLRKRTCQTNKCLQRQSCRRIKFWRQHASRSLPSTLFQELCYPFFQENYSNSP